jgi:hypothetical protein
MGGRMALALGAFVGLGAGLVLWIDAGFPRPALPFASHSTVAALERQLEAAEINAAAAGALALLTQQQVYDVEETAAAAATVLQGRIAELEAVAKAAVDRSAAIERELAKQTARAKPKPVARNPPASSYLKLQ